MCSMCPMSPLHTSLSEGHIEHCVRGTGTTVSSDTSMAVELIELEECGDTEHSLSETLEKKGIKRDTVKLTWRQQPVGDVFLLQPQRTSNPSKPCKEL
ncbi:unnamed protein product [Boreogadus saida]